MDDVQKAAITITGPVEIFNPDPAHITILPAAPRAVGPNLEHQDRVTVKKLKVLHDYLVIDPLAPPTKKGRLFMPEASSERERSHRGIVLVVGPGDFNDVGTALLPMTVEEGDLVFFGKYAGTLEEFGGREVLVMRERELRLRVPEGGYLVVRHPEQPKASHLIEDWCEICHGVPEAEAKALVEAERAQLLKLDDQACVCGHVGAGHAHRTGPCRTCDCMAFRPATPALEVEAMSAAAAERESHDAELDDMRAALVTAHVDAAILQVEDERRKCPVERCFFMQKRVQTTEGLYWIGGHCRHVHQAGLA